MLDAADYIPLIREFLENRETPDGFVRRLIEQRRRDGDEECRPADEDP